MRVKTEIDMNYDETYYWEIVVIDKGNFFTECVFEIGNTNTNIVTGYEQSLEYAEKKVKHYLEFAKQVIIKHKIKEKTKKRVWQWDDDKNEFKEIKGGC